MLYVFNNQNGIQIAWNGKAPEAPARRTSAIRGLARFIRTSSAG